MNVDEIFKAYRDPVARNIGLKLEEKKILYGC